LFERGDDFVRQLSEASSVLNDPVRCETPSVERVRIRQSDAGAPKSRKRGRMLVTVASPHKLTQIDTDVISMPGGFRRHLVGKTL